MIEHFLLAMALGFVASAAGAEASPRHAAENFLQWHVATHPSGAPSAKELDELSPLLTSELLCLLKVTVDFRDHYERIYPDEKPPFVEGDLFLSSTWEQPTRFEIDSVRINGTTAKALVHFFYEEGEGFDWRDRLLLRLENGQWRLADVDRRGLWDTANSPGSMTAALYRATSRRPREASWEGKTGQQCKALASRR